MVVNVAVIGAGAAGLVAARHLLKCNIRPIIFDMSHTIGGAWSATSTPTTPTTTGGSNDNDNDDPVGIGSTTKSTTAPTGTPTTTMNNNKPQMKMWDNLTTNLSKYTCQFSDFPWDEDEVDYKNDVSTPFVSRSEMSNYLQRYAETMIMNDNDDPTCCCFKLGCYVTQITPLYDVLGLGGLDDVTTLPQPQQDSPFLSSYQVEWKELNNDGGTLSTGNNDSSSSSSSSVIHKQTFDGVIIATGFFSKPYIPSNWFVNKNKPKSSTSSLTTDSTEMTTTTTANNNDNNNNKKKLMIQHSSQYRNPNEYENKVVAVVGSSFSSLEIAAELTQTAQKVISIVPKLPYVVPRYVPYTTTSAQEGTTEKKEFTIAPIDLILYQRRQKDGAPLLPLEQIKMTKDTCQQKHAFLRNLIGIQKQKEAFGSITTVTSQSNDDEPPMIAISDEFLNLVISGKIQVLKGRVTQISSGGNDDDNDSLRIELDDGTVVLDNEESNNIDCVIACTGYHCDTIQKLLPKEVLDILQYDSDDGFAPIVSCYDTFHPKLPGLGFVGMYRGPYMGIMELQARLLSNMMMCRDSDVVVGDVLSSLPSRDQIQAALDDSLTIRNYKPRAQFPHWDYIGHMDTIASFVNLVPRPKASDDDNDDVVNFGSNGNFVIPSYYQPDLAIAKKVGQEIHDDLKNSAMQRMPQFVLDAIVGHWTYDRTITQMSDTSIPQQKVSGDVFFSLKHHYDEKNDGDDDIFSSSSLPSPSSNSRRYWNTVLYREDGIFTLPNGVKMDVFREYEYQVNPASNTLEIYFVEYGKRAHLFLSLKFQQQQQGDGDKKKDSNVWIATSDHLCIKDLYKGEFRITLDDGLSASAITMTYRVKGPNKDYESITYLRPK